MLRISSFFYFGGCKKNCKIAWGVEENRLVRTFAKYLYLSVKQTKGRTIQLSEYINLVRGIFHDLQYQKTERSSVFLCPATKSGGVLCYTLRTFECLSVRPSVRPSVRQRLIILVRSITLIPFEIISRNMAQI